MSKALGYIRANRAVIETMGIDKFVELTGLDVMLGQEGPIDMVKALMEIEEITGEKQTKLFGKAMSSKCKNAQKAVSKFWHAPCLRWVYGNR